MEKITHTSWEPENQLISTHISGQVDLEDVERWEQSLFKALDQVADNGIFKIFVNLHGFKANNFEVHKRFRNIVPLTLSKYGWRVGYLDLFEEAANLPLSTTRGVRCTAAVHVHQDETKINLYESTYSRDNEHYFTDPQVAEQWIRDIA